MFVKFNVYAYSNQSTAKSKEMSLVGSPNAVKTNSIVINAALGMLAAPILAKVAVKLEKINAKN